MIRRPPSSPLFPNTPPFRPPPHKLTSSQPHKPTSLVPHRRHYRPTQHHLPRLVASRRAAEEPAVDGVVRVGVADRKSTRLNSSHANISYAVFCLKKKKKSHN